MLIETRESTVDNPKEFFYPNKYAIYEDSELNGYSVTDASKHSGWSSEDRKILATNVVSSIDNYGKKYFVYIILKPVHQNMFIAIMTYQCSRTWVCQLLKSYQNCKRDIQIRYLNWKRI